MRLCKILPCLINLTLIKIRKLKNFEITQAVFALRCLKTLLWNRNSFGFFLGNVSSNKKCLLCLEPRTETTSTICGHLFCWTCIHESVGNRSECPICRQPLRHAQLIPLINYSWNTNLILLIFQPRLGSQSFYYELLLTLSLYLMQGAIF